VSDDPPPPSRRGRRWLWWVIGGVVALGAIAAVYAVTRPDDSAPSAALVDGSPDRVLLSGFGEVSLNVRGGGKDYAGCLLLAETETQRDRGLMEVTDPDLGGYDGMAFVFAADSRVPFWMRNTPMPLSLAYVDADGGVVNTVDMAPCGDLPTCPLYAPEAPYRFAVEVPQGRLGRLGLGVGATAVLGPDRCGP
jgi:uncharacterized membrane protein (UPF0127 family)